MSALFDRRKEAGEYAVYHAKIHVMDRLLAGIPNDPAMMDRWIFSQGIKDTTKRLEYTLATLREIGQPIPEGETTLEEAVETFQMLAENQTEVFKQNERGIYFEGRQIRSMLKEAQAVTLPDREIFVRTLKKVDKDGKRTDQKKLLIYGAFVETVVCHDHRIRMFRDGEEIKEPDGIQIWPGHIKGPPPRSVLHRNEYVDDVEMEFDIVIRGDYFTEEEWDIIWCYGEMHGLGSARSQDNGRFEVLEWARA